MKESEAKKKLCPHGNAHQAVGNVSMSVNTYCKGSDCMMWKAEMTTESIEKELKRELNWHDYSKYAPDGFKFSHIVTGKKSNKEGNVIAEFRKPVETDSGDCGLKTKELYCEGCNQ